MDLCFKGQQALAARLLNAFSGEERSEGLAMLPYYLVHRTLVRSEVALLRAVELASEGPQLTAAIEKGLAYLALAGRMTQRCGRGAVLIMHSYSGSGKTWFARKAVEALLRSDVERKRLLSLDATERGVRQTFIRLPWQIKPIVALWKPVKQG